MRDLPRDATVLIDGRRFNLLPETRVRIEEVPNQPAQPQEWQRFLSTAGIGWGANVLQRTGEYAYADTAVLHRPLLLLPGLLLSKITGFTPLSGSFPSICEYVNQSESSRRLVIITARHAYEIDSSGAMTVIDMGTGFDLTRPMAKGVLYRSESMPEARLYVSRPSVSASDPMVERLANGTWRVSPNGKYAEALAVGQDATGLAVLWRVTESGRLNQAVATADPSDPGAWQADSASTPIGTRIAVTNDMMQIGRALYVARTDGVWTFDNMANSIHVTKGHESTFDQASGKWLKEANGALLAPTPFGLIMVEGLTWSPVGPISTNLEQRWLPARDVVCSQQWGQSIYAAVWEPAANVSWIFHGTWLRAGDTTMGPFTWHGPVAVCPGRVTDLHISTVWATALWITTDEPALYYGLLNAAGDPLPTTTAGTIYFPDGSLEVSGPGVGIELRKAEYVYPSAFPYDGNANSWTVEVLDPATSQWIPPDTTRVMAPTLVSGYWTSLPLLYRTQVRLRYSTNDPARCALQGVILRGLDRPEHTRIYRLQVLLRDRPLSALGPREDRAKEDDLEFLRGLLESGRVVTAAVDRYASFAAVVAGLKHEVSHTGPRGTVHVAELTLYEVDVRG